MFELLRSSNRKVEPPEGDPVARESERAARLFGAAPPDAPPAPVSQRPGRYTVTRHDRRPPGPSVAKIFVPGILIGGVIGLLLLIDDPKVLLDPPRRWLARVHAAPDYIGCAAIRLTGEPPLVRGEPDYSPALDTDGDGIACEPIFGESPPPRRR